MKLLVLSGGKHPYEETTPILRTFLSDAGHDIFVTEDPNIMSESELDLYDAIVFNTRREDEDTLESEQRTSLTQFIGGGKGFVVIHIASCKPKDWGEYHDVTGGGWVTGSSYHPPYGQLMVNVTNSDHPCASGITDFVTNDELYMNLEVRPNNEVFMTAKSEEGTHMWHGQSTFMPAGTFPVAWTRSYGNGRVFNTTLGHNGLSFQTPQFQQLILNGLDWACGAQ